MSSKTMTIGRLAASANVNIESIRYYERRGLIKQPRKPLSGYRQYPAELVQRIHFIKQAQTYGFSLQEIKELLKIGDSQCRDVQQKAIAKRESIKTKIKDLNSLVRALDHMIKSCDTNQSSPTCPIVTTLGHYTHK